VLRQFARGWHVFCEAQAHHERNHFLPHIATRRSAKRQSGIPSRTAWAHDHGDTARRIMKARTAIHGVILGAFCLGFGLVLAVTDQLTVDDIAARAQEDRQASLSQVVPDELHDNNLVTDTLAMKNDAGRDITVYRARRDGKITGVAYEIFGTGYAGEMKLMLGVDAAGRVLGVRVLAHKETPGLGDKIEVKKGDWILRFTGLALGNPPAERWKVRKDGGEFDQFAGATITPRGVVNAIRGGLDFFAAHQAALLEAN
jgi:electron transport complex protein RnfG